MFAIDLPITQQLQTKLSRHLTPSSRLLKFIHKYPCSTCLNVHKTFVGVG